MIVDKKDDKGIPILDQVTTHKSHGSYHTGFEMLEHHPKKKYDLIGKLNSINHYLLLDQGDFLVHFMDIAPDELDKTPNEISVEKLQSLLDLALAFNSSCSRFFA
ncbi:unnamed protein product [Lactuca virosa]|uniref:Gamma-tubulin complex component n=1 Tax=Lactuca virosa TaxID=75947 RepID=A0AAU9NCV1_9ASTR|nr:unnamed protein product [Lactuca virosa]